MKKYFRMRRTWRRSVNSTVISSKPDNRPYATIDISGKQLEGMLDSGANISVLGNGSEGFLQSCGLSYHPFQTKVHTASGTPEQILGYVDALVTFNKQTKSLRLYIAPSLSQPLYLGTDFWKLFDIRITLSELVLPKGTEENSSESNAEANVEHILTDAQRQILEILEKILDIITL